eukprot:scaffold41706_cov17-Tisochrysis_lutea.AAC.1
MDERIHQLLHISLHPCQAKEQPTRRTPRGSFWVVRGSGRMVIMPWRLPNTTSVRYLGKQSSAGAVLVATGRKLALYMCT